jgi:hypothetical protein
MADTMQLYECEDYQKVNQKHWFLTPTMLQALELKFGGRISDHALLDILSGESHVSPAVSPTGDNPDTSDDQKESNAAPTNVHGTMDHRPKSSLHRPGTDRPKSGMHVKFAHIPTGANVVEIQRAPQSTESPIAQFTKSSHFTKSHETPSPSSSPRGSRASTPVSRPTSTPSFALTKPRIDNQNNTYASLIKELRMREPNFVHLNKVHFGRFVGVIVGEIPGTSGGTGSCSSG